MEQFLCRARLWWGGVGALHGAGPEELAAQADLFGQRIHDGLLSLARSHAVKKWQWARLDSACARLLYCQGLAPTARSDATALVA